MYMDPADARHVDHEHIVVIMNHTYEIDWLMAWMLAEHHKMLGVGVLHKLLANFCIFWVRNLMIKINKS